MRCRMFFNQIDRRVFFPVSINRRYEPPVEPSGAVTILDLAQVSRRYPWDQATRANARGHQVRSARRHASSIRGQAGEPAG
jgi:hypothetical protein